MTSTSQSTEQPTDAERAAVDALMPGIEARKARALGRAISIVEGGGAARRELIRRLYEKTGNARVVGVTGPPGAGKSTLVERLARKIRERGQTVAVLAVDPTSPYTGGALLGDRIRMQSLYLDRDVYIRSMATRGAMGGLARASHDAVDVLDAAGFDWVLVETVGVGQDEVDVVRSVETVLVVTVPGLGDDIQAIKAGLMEIADVFVINKADRDGVDRTVRDLETMLGLAEIESDWKPPIVQTVASRGEGVDDVIAEMRKHRQHLVESGALAERRRQLLRLRVEAILKERVLAEADAELGLDREVDRGLEARDNPYRVADRLFAGAVRHAEVAETESGS
ncbi:MAG TPA: methylmalonyl Co-A mutase-associated GTPase MeaB [Thermoanaerobaculia bacterium]|nr:methylmalonyl Co-A mutase-associated GTPase MeaB [Thermoanaerobaculia bacterium]